MRRRTPGLPPLQAKSGWLSAPSRSTSWVRPERIGPTGSASWRVEHGGEAGERPSTISSNTMSAWLSRSAGGRASTLSILTTIAGRSGAASPVGERQAGERASGIGGGRRGRRDRRRGRRRRSWRPRSSSGAVVVGLGLAGSVVVAGAGRRGRRRRRRRRCTRASADRGRRPGAERTARRDEDGRTGDVSGSCQSSLSRRSARRAAGGCRTCLWTGPAGRRRRRRTSVARSTGGRWRWTPSASPWCRRAASPAPRSDPADTGSAGTR